MTEMEKLFVSAMMIADDHRAVPIDRFTNLDEATLNKVAEEEEKEEIICRKK